MPRKFPYWKARRGKMVSASSYYHPSYGDLKEKLLASLNPFFSALIFNGSHHVIRSSLRAGGKRKRKLCFQFHVVSFFLRNKYAGFFPSPLSYYTVHQPRREIFPEGWTMWKLSTKRKSQVWISLVAAGPFPFWLRDPWLNFLLRLTSSAHK